MSAHINRNNMLKTCGIIIYSMLAIARTRGIVYSMLKLANTQGIVFSMSAIASTQGIVYSMLAISYSPADLEAPNVKEVLKS